MLNEEIIEAAEAAYANAFVRLREERPHAVPSLVDELARREMLEDVSPLVAGRVLRDAADNLPHGTYHAIPGVPVRTGVRESEWLRERAAAAIESADG